MKRIIRLTESDLHGMVRNAVKRILRESNDNQTIMAIANAIEQQWEPVSLSPGDNEIDVELGGNASAYITFNLVCDPYIQPGMRSQSRDVPDDPDEIVDEPEVEVNQIVMYYDGGDEQNIVDDGTIQSTIEMIVSGAKIDYDWNSVPTQDEYFYHED